MSYTCTECATTIPRHISPSHAARRKWLFCSKEHWQQYSKKHWHYIWSDRTSRFSTHPPARCTAKVTTCEQCPYKDCIL